MIVVMIWSRPRSLTGFIILRYTTFLPYATKRRVHLGARLFVISTGGVNFYSTIIVPVLSGFRWSWYFQVPEISNLNDQLSPG